MYRINPNSITNSNNINSIIKRQSDIIAIAIMNIDYFRLENLALKNEIYDWTARSIMFAGALSPTTYRNSKILPITISRRTTTLLKSILFALSINLYTILKFRKKIC
jgi:hypothetical protein